MSEKFDIPVLKHCSDCGHELVREIPEGDHVERYVCPACRKVHYQNPKNIVGTIPFYGDRVLLCRRAIPPKVGKWTLPAGHQEMKETTGEGAERETWEEAGVKVKTGDPYIMMDLPFASASHFFFLAPMESEESSPGSESLECRLFKEEEIPWDEIAFGTVYKALEVFFEDRRRRRFDFHYFQKLVPGVKW